MVQLISNFTAAAAAATALRILDFQKGHGLDVTGAQCTDLTPVQSFLTGKVGNQEIVSNCGKFLTYPGALTGAMAIRSQATILSEATSSWTVALVNPAIPTGPWKYAAIHR
ncbi:hypothetical protein B0H13DRAFT_2084597 [Mycena leptocephala]|nr:hypothetical protein B0H13DRAFT_2084597 [Mycena leptocephala]